MSRESSESTLHGSPVIQSRYVRMIAVSAESGWLRSSRLICFSISVAASCGIFLSVMILR